MIKNRIRAYYPNYFGDKQISYVALRIILFWNDSSTSADVMGISSFPSMKKFKKYSPGDNNHDKSLPSGLRVYRDAIPCGLVWAVVRRIFSLQQIMAISEWRFYCSLRKGDIVYIWPDASLRLHEKLNRAGFFVISERINTLLASSKKILDNEYRALGINPSHGITDDKAAVETACMKLSNVIFSPSPGVSDSILSAGIEEKRIIHTSYGLESREVLPFPENKNNDTGVTLIFVGSICVRKGIHLLFKAWDEAAVGSARLVLVGKITPEVKDIVSAAMEKHPSITHQDFVDDLVPVYQCADCFVLPSLEEGSPLVSYLALGAGLPLLVSEMGAGGIIEDGKEGLIIDPHNTGQFAEALERIISDSALRKQLGRAAREKAPFYTWEKVAGRRKEQLLPFISQR